MKVWIALRVAAGLAFVQYCAHAYRFLSAGPPKGAAALAVDAMRANAFDVAGSSRTYWDFYFGYGLMAIVSGVVEAVALWHIATLAKTDPRRVAPLVLLFLCANVAHAVLAWSYFFVTPVVPDMLIAVILGGSLFATYRAA